MVSLMAFVFDTNSFRVLSNYYPDKFPTFWDLFNSAVSDNLILSTREVFGELKTQVADTYLQQWIIDNRYVFLMPSPEETAFVGEIFTVNHFQTLVGASQRLRGTPVADPFVIASAKIHERCVVTEESLKKNAAKIPNVCEHFQVAYTNFEGFLDRMNWRF